MDRLHSDSHRAWLWFFLVILGIGAALRLWTIGYSAPWLDEVHSLVYARNSVAHLLDINRTTDIHPPLYFLILKGWTAVFGESREAARVLSTLASMTCLVLFYVIVRRYLGTPAALIATGFLATFPTSVHYAREIRMYPVLTLFFLSSFLYFQRLGDKASAAEDAGNARLPIAPLLGFSVCLALTFYTHYSAAIFYMLYTVAAAYFLIRGERQLFWWLFIGLFIATILVAPQLTHLFASSLGDPDKGWMEPTTLSLFYSITLGAFPYPALLKPIMVIVFAAGFVILWLQHRSLSIVAFIFTAGGMITAAVIGIFEPIYLVRTIQVYTLFAAVPVAALLLWLPKPLAITLGVGLATINIYTIFENTYLPEPVPLLADELPEFVALLDAEKDQVFAKDYVQRQMRLMHVPLFETAKVISHASQAEDIAEIREQAARCLGENSEAHCRSLVLIIEKESRFNVEAIAAWNALADDLKAANPSNFEQVLAGYRVVVLAKDDSFRREAAMTLGYALQ